MNRAHTMPLMRNREPSSNGHGYSPPLCFQPIVRHPHLRRLRTRQVPVVLLLTPVRIATRRSEDAREAALRYPPVALSSLLLGFPRIGLIRRSWRADR